MMSNQLTLPAFPLSTVLLPGEATKIHIFEDRYKELIKDCTENNASFAIPFIENDKQTGYGCEVKIKSVIKEYKDGRKDVLVEAIRVFKILESTVQLMPKLYGAVQIEFENNNIHIIDSKLEDAIIHYYNVVQDKIMDYETLSNLTIYNIANSLDLNPKEKINLITAKNKQVVLLNQINFITHIVNAEQRLENRYMFN